MTTIKYGCRHNVHTNRCHICRFNSNDKACEEYRIINNRYIIYNIEEIIC